MVCKSCDKDAGEGLGNDLEFTKVEYDVSVLAGETWHLYVDVYNNSFFFGDEGRVCVYDGDIVIAQSNRFELKPAKSIRLNFSGVMPNRDLYLNASLVKEQMGLTRCEDGHAVYIKEGPSDLIDPSDPEYDEDSISEWIQDNLVLVLVLILAIIIILKFG